MAYKIADKKVRPKTKNNKKQALSSAHIVAHVYYRHKNFIVFKLKKNKPNRYQITLTFSKVTLAYILTS